MAFTFRDIRQYVYCNYFFPVDDVTNFEIKVKFLISSFSKMTKKIRPKI